MGKLRFITLALSIYLLTACTPSQQAIQKAIAQTQAALPTNSPPSIPSNIPANTPTSIRTNTPILYPTDKPRTPNYILETGFCALDIGAITDNPTDHEGCFLESREQIYMDDNSIQTITFTNFSDREVYCSLYTLQGVYIMSDIDTKGSGRVVCTPMVR